MARLPTIDAYMDKTIHQVAPETPIRDVAELLLQLRITGIPVVDPDGKLLGIVTEFDCLKLLSTGDGVAPVGGTAADFMTRNPLTVPPTMNIYFCAGIFLGNSFRRMPVVQNGKLLGSVTRFDLLRALRDHKA